MRGPRGHIAAWLGGVLLLLSGGATQAGVIAIPAPWLWITWEPAEGPVVGYAVFVSRGGREPLLEQWVLDERAVITGRFGEELEIEVMAFDAAGNFGPPSPPSSPFRFVSPSQDPDADVRISSEDNCALVWNPLQGDADGDGVGDGCDACLWIADPAQADADLDGIGDRCECGDANGDGWVDDADAERIQSCGIGLIDDPALCGERCDVTADGSCDTIDAQLIRRFAQGLVEKDELVCALR